MPMSGLEFVLVLVVLAIAFWPSKKGKGLFARARGWFAPRTKTSGARTKAAGLARPPAPAPREEPVKPAQPPAVRVGRSRRAYVRPRAGAAR